MKIFILCAAIATVVGVSAMFFIRPKGQNVLETEDFYMQDENGQIELIGLTDTQEEAEKLADDYGIEFKSYGYGVAVFTTDKTFQEITEIGRAKGLKTLSRNVENKAY